MLNLRRVAYANDFSPIEEGCVCTCCRPREEGGLGITKAFIYHVASKETSAAHLLTMHNVQFQISLMESVRKSIIEDQFPQFLRDFFLKLYPNKKYPEWVVGALEGVGVQLA